MEGVNSRPGRAGAAASGAGSYVRALAVQSCPSSGFSAIGSTASPGGVNSGRRNCATSVARTKRPKFAAAGVCVFRRAPAIVQPIAPWSSATRMFCSGMPERAAMRSASSTPRACSISSSARL